MVSRVQVQVLVGSSPNKHITTGQSVPRSEPVIKLLEIKPMEKTIEKAVKLLAEKITADVKSDDALRFTQAALNLAHVLGIKSNIRLTDRTTC